MLTAPGLEKDASPSSLRPRGPVVVAVGPTGGVAAASAGRAIAESTMRELVVVSIVEPPPVYTFETNRALLLPWLVEQQTAERREAVHDLVHRLGMRDPDREPEIQIVYGEAEVEIPRFARLLGAGLIVMGIGPHDVRRRLVSAGTVATVSQHAPCPVLAVSEHARVPARIAIIATDFSPESLYAARVARTLVAEDAVVDVVHAWHRLDAVSPNVALATLNERYVDSLAGQFDRVRDALVPVGSLAIHPVALEGKAADIVLDIARVKRADLIVCATHGHGAMHRWLVGSTSSALLRHADCSILLVPTPPLAERTWLARTTAADTAVSSDRAEWDEELRAFVERNQFRRTRLEIEAPSLGAQIEESGYTLTGATYDPRDRQIGLMFGGARVGEPHLTHSLRAVRSLSVRSDEAECDEALLIRTDESDALLTFLPEPAPRSSVIA